MRIRAPLVKGPGTVVLAVVLALGPAALADQARGQIEQGMAALGNANPAGHGAQSAHAGDGCAWQPGFVLPDLDGNVGAMEVYDDGSGPALYVGGQF
jgi:hypothetical protein